MKTRIIALILTVVMALLALTSCNSGYDLATENLDAYAEFDLDKFLDALQNIEIEDGDFTTDEATRNKIVAAQIYNTIVDKIVADTDEEDYIKSGELTAGDVLYFVYYAVDADKNEFFGTDMKLSAITDSSTKANHVIKLGDNLDADGNEFFKLIAENLAEGNLEDFIFSALTAAELQSKAAEDLTAENPDATEEELTAAKEAAIKLQAGDKVYIGFTRTYSKATETEGVTTDVTEVATYTLVTLDAEDPLYKHFFAEGATANVGTEITFGTDESGNAINSVEVVEGDVTYTYKSITVHAKVENEGKPIATFEYTPYDDDTKEVAPSSVYTTASKVNLGKKALTYYVYPVYAIDALSFDEITAADILYYVNGSKLVESSYAAFEVEGYTNGDETLEDFLKDITLIFDSTADDNDWYADGTDLKAALDEYNEAVEAGGSTPTTAQKEVITEKNNALTDAKNAALKEVIAKIVAAKSGDKVLGEEIREEYVDSAYHTLKETYDSDIISKVREKVLELMYEHVTIKAYPQDLLDEFVDHLYESYEYDFYTGDFDTNTTNYEKYGTLEKYLEKKLGTDVDAALEKEAKGYLDPILKIFVIAQKLNSKASEDMPGYVESNVEAGVYRTDGVDDEESIADAREEAKKFLIDDAYIKDLKSEVSSSYYNQLVEEYGDINIRTALQFNKLFSYLTSNEYVYNDAEEHADVKYTEDGTKLAFRNLSYSIAVEDAEEESADE